MWSPKEKIEMWSLNEEDRNVETKWIQIKHGDWNVETKILKHGDEQKKIKT